MSKKRSLYPTASQTSISASIQRYIQAHQRAAKISWNEMKKTPAVTFMTILAMGLCFAIPVSLYLFVKNVQQFSQGWDQHASMTLYLDNKASIQQVNTVLQKVKEYRFVEKANYINPESALKEFQQHSQMGDILSLLNENPLPGVITLQIASKGIPAFELDTMKSQLSQMPMVSSASFDYDWLKKLERFIAFGRVLSQFLYCLIGLGVVLMVGNTIRLALERHREEIEVLTLVGATLSFIRRPFLYRGVLFGLLSGLIAIFIVFVALGFIKQPTEELISLYQGVFRLHALSFADITLVLMISTLLGWFGSVIAFGQQQSALHHEH